MVVPSSRLMSARRHGDTGAVNNATDGLESRHGREVVETVLSQIEALEQPKVCRGRRAASTLEQGGD